MADSRFLELCRTRRSVRKWADKPVERTKIELCIEAARLAPSADNVQPWRFIIYDDPRKRDALADAIFRGAFAASRWVAKAPVIVVLLMKENVIVNRLGGAAAGNPFQHVDIGIAGEHFALAAAEQGIGTCWIGWFDSRACIKHLGLKGKGFRAVCLFATGYPAADASTKARPRKEPGDISFWNSPPR